MFMKLLKQFLGQNDRISNYKAADAEQQSYQRLLLKIEAMEKELSLCRQALDQQAMNPPVIIEHLNIEHLNIDKLQHENNFGALGIKELSGQLNIGANYYTGRPQTVKNSGAAPFKPLSAVKSEEGPRCTIRAQKSEDHDSNN